DPEPAAAVHDALVVGDVAGGVDSRGRGLQAAVKLDSTVVAKLEPGVAGERHIWYRPGPHHDGVGLQLDSRLGDDAGDAAVGALEAIEGVVAVDVDPMLLEPVLEEPPGLLAEPAAEHHRLQHHQRAGATELR